MINFTGDHVDDQSAPVTNFASDHAGDQSAPVTNFTGDHAGYQSAPVINFTGDHAGYQSAPVTNFTGDHAGYQSAPVAKFHRWPKYTGDQTSPVSESLPVTNSWPVNKFTATAQYCVPHSLTEEEPLALLCNKYYFRSRSVRGSVQFLLVDFETFAEHERDT